MFINSQYLKKCISFIRGFVNYRSWTVESDPNSNFSRNDSPIPVYYYSHSSFLCMVYPATCPLRALVLLTPADLHASSDRWIQDTYAAKMSRIQTRITNLHKSEKSDKRLLLAAGDSLKTDHFPQEILFEKYKTLKISTIWSYTWNLGEAVKHKL